MTKYLLWMLCFAFPGILFAQRRNAIKTDLTALAQKGGRLAYEFRLSPKSSLELSIGFQKHANQPDWIFHGDQIAYYLQRKLDTFDFAGRLLNSSGWQNVESQPLPDAPDFLPLFSANYRLGWRFVYEKARSKWRFFLQPGLNASSTRFFEITGGRRTENYYEEHWSIGTYPFQQKVERESVTTQQTRSMRLKNTWNFGLTYDLGFVRKWGKHFFLEGRLSTGGNLSVPYKSTHLPLTLRGLWAQPVLMAGWGF